MKSHQLAFVNPFAAINDADPRIYSTIDIAGHSFPMLLDSGAAASWIGPEPAKLLSHKIRSTDSLMVLPNGELIKDDGLVDIVLTINNHEINHTFKVSHRLSNYDVIMGIDLYGNRSHERTSNNV